MGIYLNPGNEVFRRIVSARIYVDKSGLLEVTNSMLDTDDNYICMSRPRRFGKTVAGNMIAAYIYALNKYTVKYTVIKEMTTGKGFADVVYIPFKEEIPAMVIELKHNKCAESALMQIKEKKYFASLEHYSGALLLVGISYDEKTKEHECRIERWEK